jgi:two-component system, NtrC family, sensor kinase
MTPNVTAHQPGDRPERRVLVVEDDEDILDSVSSILESAGYRVDGCANGKVALDRLQQESADAVVLDLMMPVMSGWEFVTAKKADPSIAEIPVVAISADNSAKATAIRADSYIPKPFDADELVTAVGRVLLDADRRKLARRLDEMERLALVGLIAAGVGHEINNPLGMATASVTLIERTLASMSNRLHLLNRAEPLERLFECVDPPLESVQAQLSDCRRDLERIRVIVRDLRSVSRRAEDERTVLDVGALLESVISMAGSELSSPILVVRQYDQSVRVCGNETRLMQVFLNLVVNAAQSLPKDWTEHRHIFVGARKEGDVVVIKVRDTGRGMTPAQMERIFEPFFTTKGQLGGTGLGLAICKDILQSHGGTIELTSEVGRGSSFVVRLPGVAGADAQCPAAVVPKSPPWEDAP